MPVAGQTIPLASDPVDLPTVTIDSAETVVADHERVVWLVQTNPAADLAKADGALEFVVQDGMASMHGEHGAFRAAPAQAYGRRLAAGAIVPLATSSGADLLVRVSLVDARLLPDRLPAGTIASEPFPAPGAGALPIELRRGAIAPGERGLILADEAPALLLALDAPLRLEPRQGTAIEVPQGGVTLLTHNATLYNAGSRNAAFIVTWLDQRAGASSTPLPTPTPQTRDAALADAWQQNGCHLNPSNPACLTVSLATACGADPAAAGCGADSDADTCRDVAEVRAGLDPFDPGDCLGAGDGSPLLNCLFPAGNLACDGESGAGETAHLPAVDCGLVTRDPTCDGFDLGGGRSTGR